MEEAVEYLVKVYLEKKGYMVITNKKYQYLNKIKLKTGKIQTQKSPIELDIIAINPKENDKIVGEVKGWFGSTGAHKDLFKGLGKKFDPKHDRFKIINNINVQKAVFENLEKEYGSGFRHVVYMGHIYKPHKQELLAFIKKLKINNKEVELVQFDTIMTSLIRDVKRKIPYENEIQ
jgi:hypothetical protein